MHIERIRLSSLHGKIMSAEQAAAMIEDGMTVGMSGFTRAGDAKAVPMALVERAKESPLKHQAVHRRQPRQRSRQAS